MPIINDKSKIMLIILKPAKAVVAKNRNTKEPTRTWSLIFRKKDASSPKNIELKKAKINIMYILVGAIKKIPYNKIDSSIRNANIL